MSSVRHRSTAGVVMVLLFAVGCGDDGPDADAAVAAGPAMPTVTQTVDVIALDNTFRPEKIEISAGTTVRWENRGRNDHNVLPVDDVDDWGVPTEQFAPGDEYSSTFHTPGTYPYYCSIHATKDVGMIGTVVVLPAER
jgi:plastocyanin